MPNCINPGIIDVNPTTLKPILFTTYKPITKYILDITYEDSTTKQVELVTGDRKRPYQFTFKKEGKLITAIGVPKVYQISEGNKFCDFVNRVMDSEDLLIELDCSSTYSCTKVKFYLKDVRDIEDLFPEEDNNECSCGCNCTTDLVSKYPIYLNGFDCKTKIRCLVDDDLEAYLEATITKVGETLSEDQYKDFDVFVFDEDNKINVYKYNEHGKFVLRVTEDLLETEVKILIKYFVNEIDHPVYDEFTIIPFRKDEEDGKTLDKAVTTQDTQYLGDGLKPALGVGMTPSYKQYRNSKNYSNSVIDDK